MFRGSTGLGLSCFCGLCSFGHRLQNRWLICLLLCQCSWRLFRAAASCFPAARWLRRICLGRRARRHRLCVLRLLGRATEQGLPFGILPKPHLLSPNVLELGSSRRARDAALRCLLQDHEKLQAHGLLCANAPADTAPSRRVPAPLPHQELGKQWERAASLPPGVCPNRIATPLRALDSTIGCLSSLRTAAPVAPRLLSASVL